MTYNWQAILGGLVGGVLAGIVAGYASTQVLPAAAVDYATSEMVWAAVVAALGGVLCLAGAAVAILPAMLSSLRARRSS